MIWMILSWPIPQSPNRSGDGFAHDFAGRMDSVHSGPSFPGIHKVSDWFWSDKERHKNGRRDLNSARRFIVSQAFQKLGIKELSLAEEIADAFSAQREEEIFLFEKAEETLEILDRAKYFPGPDDQR